MECACASDHGAIRLNRREFCYSLVALSKAAGAAQLWATEGDPSGSAPAVWDSSKHIRFVLNDLLDHPLYWWPRTLLTYPIAFEQPVDLDRLVLTRADTGERVPMQFSELVRGASGVKSATLNFCSDLPSGGSSAISPDNSESPTGPGSNTNATASAG